MRRNPNLKKPWHCLALTVDRDADSRLFLAIERLIPRRLLRGIRNDSRMLGLVELADSFPQLIKPWMSTITEEELRHAFEA